MRRHDRREDLFWRHVPLLLAELVLASLGVAAITVTTEEPAYEMFVHLAVLCGILWSAWDVKRQRLSVAPGAIVMLLAFAFFAVRQMGLPFVSLFYPPEVALDDDRSVAAMVGWLLVAFSFWQSSRPNLIFLVVSGLATCGLIGTINLNVEMRLIFSLYVVSAVFCWGYAQFLDMDDRLEKTGQKRLANWPDMIRGHLSIAVLVGILTLTLGSIVGTGAYHASPDLYSKMARQMRGWRASERFQQLYNSFESSFDVGTGAVHLSPLPVLNVTADHPSLWRGVAYDHYTGQGWQRTLRSGWGLPQGPNDRYQVQRGFVEEMGSHRVNRQQIHTFGPTGVIFGAAQPSEVALQLSRGGWVNIDAYGCLTAPEAEYARDYEVESWEPVAEAELLRAGGTDYPEWVTRSFVGVPAHTELALRDLVKEITAGLDTPYDRVVALQRYLEKTCLYSLAPPAVPRGKDAVAFFVFESQRGACDLFATSLAVMARIADVPARVATGYATGESDQDLKAYVVRGTDAHAWTEVYFPNAGWVTFDAQASEQYEEQSWTELVSSGHWRLALRKTVRHVIWILALGAILFFGIAAITDPLHLLRSLLQPRAQTNVQRLSQEYQGLYQTLLRRFKLTPDPWLTPQEAVEQLSPKLRARMLDPRRLAALNDRFYALRYALEAPEEEVAALRQELAAIRKRLRKRH